ncbi:MAG: hypothetical protein ACK5PF_00625 [bacterium]|jgi:hypothetical protein
MNVEAMKQALDALEIGYKSVNDEAVETYAYVGYKTAIYEDVKQIADAITTLRAAIEQAEEPRWKLSCGCPSQYGGIPAEWATTDREGSPAIAYGVICEKHWHEYDAQHPQRAWQGLTDDEIEDEWERITGHSIFGGDKAEGRAMYLAPDEVTEFTRAVETKLKEKNT